MSLIWNKPSVRRFREYEVSKIAKRFVLFSNVLTFVASRSFYLGTQYSQDVKLQLEDALWLWHFTMWKSKESKEDHRHLSQRVKRRRTNVWPNRISLTALFLTFLASSAPLSPSFRADWLMAFHIVLVALKRNEINFQKIRETIWWIRKKLFLFLHTYL